MDIAEVLSFLFMLSLMKLGQVRDEYDLSEHTTEPRHVGIFL
jgi:hypothetical protein